MGIALHPGTSTQAALSASAFERGGEREHVANGTHVAGRINGLNGSTHHAIESAINDIDRDPLALITQLLATNADHTDINTLVTTDDLERCLKTIKERMGKFPFQRKNGSAIAGSCGEMIFAVLLRQALNERGDNNLRQLDNNIDASSSLGPRFILETPHAYKHRIRDRHRRNGGSTRLYDGVVHSANRQIGSPLFLFDVSASREFVQQPIEHDETQRVLQNLRIMGFNVHTFDVRLSDGENHYQKTDEGSWSISLPRSKSLQQMMRIIRPHIAHSEKTA